MTNENIPERTNFTNEVLLIGKRSLYDLILEETLFKQDNYSWIIFDKGGYTNAHPDFGKTLDDILQRKLNESNI